MATRENMIERVIAGFRETAAHTGRDAPQPEVIEAIRHVAREEFVGLRDRARAYDDRPLPIGHGQTISQPFIVALMADLIDPKPTDRVLEIGTGCGYSAAVVARLVAEVYTIETVPALARRARERLWSLGYDNIHVRHADGSRGWPEAAPFDAILVTAAAAAIPEALVEQLAAPGVMVLPVGRLRMGQELMRITKDSEGRVEERSLLPVAFVPLVHGRRGTQAPDAK